ncbi:AEC family transporter [Methanobacterium sp. ACI-7]|uniref:AEC family transporter n=1 Tax=unclassified Methanobacterium TaxID=2627676 RepID=UPI0039C23AC8
MNAIETIIPIIIMIAIGYFLKRLKILKPDDANLLNKIVINIAIPALIFIALYDIDISILPVIAPIPLICIAVGILSGLVAYIFAKIKKYPQKTTWSIMLTSSMFNSGFLGYPFVLGVFGDDGLVRAVFYDLGSMMLFILFGVILLLIYGGKYTTILKRALIFPPLWAVALAIILNYINFEIGPLILNTLDYLSGAAIPLIMISLGLSLEFRGIKENVHAVFSVSIIKLIIAPAIASVIVLLLGIGGLERQVTIIEAAMPSAMLSLVLAITYDLDIKTAASCIFTSTILSLTTIPLVLVLIS